MLLRLLGSSAELRYNRRSLKYLGFSGNLVAGVVFGVLVAGFFSVAGSFSAGFWFAVVVGVLCLLVDLLVLLEASLSVYSPSD